MPDEVYNYNPQGGEIPHGTEIITCNGTPYIADSDTGEAGVNVLRRKDEKGRPNGLKGINEPRAYNGVWQLANTSTPIPARQAIFTSETITYVITNVSKPRQQDALTVVNITATERI